MKRAVVRRSRADAMNSLGAVMLAALTAALAPGAASAQGQAAAPQAAAAAAIDTISGPWELTDPKTKRSCRIQLGAAKATHGYVFGAPPACRTGFPITTQVSAWVIGEGRSITFVDAAGRTVADFKAEKEGRFAAAEPVRLTLTPVGDRATAIGTALVKAGMSELPAITPDALVGLYGVARDKYKPVCSIELTSRPAARRGQFVAILSGGCIDSGLKTFDPIAWYTERGRLHLVARKGHEQSFAPGADKIYEKNPPSGAQIYLRKQ